MRYYIRTSLFRILAIMGLLTLASCSLFDYHPYDGKVTGATALNAAHIRQIEEQCARKDTIRFAVISDTQRWFDEMQRMIDKLNSMADTIDFVVHCGDFTDFGATQEFMWQRDMLQKLQKPYVAIIGNHDCLATGKGVFQSVFGPTDFSFNAGFIHFVCLNTNALDDPAGNLRVPDFGFLQTDVQQTDSLQTPLTILSMHSAPDTEQFNTSSIALFEHTIKQYPHALLALCGHGHHTNVRYPLGDDSIPFYECGAANNMNYLVFTVTRQGYEYEAHSLR